MFEWYRPIGVVPILTLLRPLPPTTVRVAYTPDTNFLFFRFRDFLYEKKIQMHLK